MSLLIPLSRPTNRSMRVGRAARPALIPSVRPVRPLPDIDQSQDVDVVNGVDNDVPIRWNGLTLGLPFPYATFQPRTKPVIKVTPQGLSGLTQPSMALNDRTMNVETNGTFRVLGNPQLSRTIGLSIMTAGSFSVVGAGNLTVTRVPTAVMCRNVGNGSIEVSWTGADEAVSYNVYLSQTLNGTYKKANLAPIYDTKVLLPNISFGTTVYVKVTSVNLTEESVLSQVGEDAVCAPGVTTLQFSGLAGDKIAAGAMFTAPVGGRLVSFVTLAEGICGSWADGTNTPWVDGTGFAWESI